MEISRDTHEMNEKGNGRLRSDAMRTGEKDAVDPDQEDDEREGSAGFVFAASQSNLQHAREQGTISIRIASQDNEERRFNEHLLVVTARRDHGRARRRRPPDGCVD
jgi:hypothetical protein